MRSAGPEQLSLLSGTLKNDESLSTVHVRTASSTTADRYGQRESICQREYSARRQLRTKNERCPFFARLFSHTAHDATVGVSESLLFVHLLSDLTYRQLVILSAYADKGAQIGDRIGPDPELDDLGERYLLGIDDDGTPRVPSRLFGVIDSGSPSSAMAGMSEASVSEAKRSSLALMPTGRRLVELTGATESIPSSERSGWIATRH